MSDLRPLIEVEGLTVTFRYAGGLLTAVRDVSFVVAPGETFGIVGESGSGKSTALRVIAGLIRPSSGRIAIAGEEVGQRRSKAQRRALQFVFQDPYGSLHPRQTVDAVLREPLAIHRLPDPEKRVRAAMADVDLAPSFRFRYPHQLSGGQRQRVAIARALILDPKILLLDEPTSALDVSVQAEILNLLVRIRAEHGLTGILVSHDLGVVAHLCQRIAVMRRGAIVEMLSVEALRGGGAQEPYTRGLIDASRGYKRREDLSAGAK